MAAADSASPPLLPARSAILEAWCRLQQRVWPALFCLRVAGRPGTTAPASAVAVAHADGSYHVALNGRRVALCDGCRSLVPAPLAAGEAPRRDSVALCGVCGFHTALDSALRRALGRWGSVSAGMCLPEDVARVIVLEAAGPWGCGAEPPCPWQQAFADSDLRRRRALQELVDLIGVEDCVPSAPTASDIEGVLWNERVEEGAWLLQLISGVEGGVVGERAVARTVSVSPDELIRAKLLSPALQDDTTRKSDCVSCRDAVEESRNILGKVLGDFVDLTLTRAESPLESWDSLAVYEQQSFTDRNACESRRKLFEAGRKLQCASDSVMMHILRCKHCLVPSTK